jgi:hypothetical protein
MVPFDKSATLTSVAMDHKQHNLSKLFEKQDAVALDDLNDDEDPSVASESKASIAGHLRSMLTRTASKMNVTKSEDDDASVISTSEGSVMSTRSVLSRTASGLSSGLRRGSQLLRTSSFRSMGSFRHKEDAEKGRNSLYGSSRDLNDSSNSSLGSVDILDDLSHGEGAMPSAPSQPKFDLSMMKTDGAQQKDLMVNEEDRSTVWVKSGEEGNQHLQLDIRNHSSFGSLFDDDSHVNYHSSGRSLISDDFDSSNPSLFSSKGSNNSIISSSTDMEESHHSRLPNSRRGRRPRRLSVDRASAGTTSANPERTLTRHLSANRIDVGGKGDDVLRSSKSACGIAAEALKNPRRRRTQRPKGFSNMKLHSSSGAIDQADFDAIDRRCAQNEEWSNLNTPKSGIGQNILLNKLKTKGSFEDPKNSLRRSDDIGSQDKLRGLNRYSSGRSLRASGFTDSVIDAGRKEDDDGQEKKRGLSRFSSGRSLRSFTTIASSQRGDDGDGQEKILGDSRRISGRSLRSSAGTENKDFRRRSEEDDDQDKTRKVNRHSSALSLGSFAENERNTLYRGREENDSQDKLLGVRRHSSTRSLRSSSTIESKDSSRKRDDDGSQEKKRGLNRHSSRSSLKVSAETESKKRGSDVSSRDKKRGLHRQSSRNSLTAFVDNDSKFVNQRRDDLGQDKTRGVTRHSSGLSFQSLTSIENEDDKAREVGRTFSGRSCLKAPKRRSSGDVVNNLKESSDANHVPDKSRKSVARTVSYGRGVTSGMPPRTLSHSSPLVGSGDGSVQKIVMGTDVDDDAHTTDTYNLRKNSSRSKEIRNISSENLGERSYSKGPHVKLSRGMLNSLGQSIGTKHNESNGPTELRESVTRAMSFNERKSSKAQLRGDSHRCSSLVNVNARQKKDDNKLKNAAWDIDEYDVKDEDDLKRRNMRRMKNDSTLRA